MSQAILDYLASGSFLTAALGVVTGYITPLAGLVLVLLGIIWHIMQIRKEIRNSKNDSKHR